MQVLVKYPNLVIVASVDDLNPDAVKPSVGTVHAVGECFAVNKS